MHEPSYRQALSRALALVYQQKGIWVFGVLSLLLGQIGWNNFVGGLVFFSEKQSFYAYFYNMPFIGFWHGANIFWSLWLVIIMLALSLFVIVLAVISEGALIAAAVSWYKGEKKINLGQAWHLGARHFSRLFLLHLIKKTLLVLLLVGLNFSIVYFEAFSEPSSTLLTIALVTVGLFLALVIATVGIFAAGYIVEGELTFFEAIEKAVVLFKEHVLVALEVSLILLVVQMLVILLFILSTTWFLLPFVAFSVLGGFTGSKILIVIGLFLSFILFFAFAALIGGLLNAFSVSAWMYLFMKMHHEGIKSRVLHFLKLKSL